MDIEVKAFENTNRIVTAWYGAAEASILGGVGLVAHRGDEMIASAFMIPTYSNFLFFEGVKTNPASTPFSRAKAVRILVRTMIKWGTDHGYEFVTGFMGLENKSLIKEYQRQGAAVSERPVHCVTRRLHG